MSAATEPTAVITIRVSESMRKQIDALAKSTDRTRQFHALEAMRRYPESEAWQVGLIEERIRQADASEIGYAVPKRVAAVFDKYSAHRDEHAG